MPSREKLMKIALLIGLCGVLTTVLQSWVGSHTIYARQYEENRRELHVAILENRLPEGRNDWADFGANGTNVRLFVVLVAEGMHRALGITVNLAYQVIDSISLFIGFLLLFVYLRHWLDERYCLIGVLFVAFVSILSYFLFFFHPWDRIGLVVWILLLFLIRQRRPILVSFTLVPAMAIKYDAIFVPALYGLYTFGKADRVKWLLTTGALVAVTIGTYVGLVTLRPGGFADTPLVDTVTEMVARNINDLRLMHVAHPPALAFLLPICLAIPHLFSRDRFVWSSALFGFAMFFPHLVLTNFLEVRAQMPILILLAPAALLNLREILERSPGGGSPTGSHSAV